MRREEQVDRERKSLEEKSTLDGEDRESRRREECVSLFLRRVFSVLKRWGCDCAEDGGGAILVAEGCPQGDDVIEVYWLCLHKMEMLEIQDVFVRAVYSKSDDELGTRKQRALTGKCFQ